MEKKKEQPNANRPMERFAYLMRGLIGVRKEELDAEERKYQKKKKRKKL